MKGGGNIPDCLQDFIFFLARVIKKNGWELVRFWVKAQPAGGTMSAHQDSANRGFHTSVVHRFTLFGDGGYIDMISTSNPNVVQRVHLPLPGSYSFGPIGGGVVSPMNFYTRLFQISYIMSL